ncbi:MAG: BatA domain-containing protein [Woeseiaceae bacterium]
MFETIWPGLSVLIAASTVVIIHSLFRRARKRVTVATLKPFGATTSPRWQWIRPDHWWLLALRLSIFVLLLWLVLRPTQMSDQSKLEGNIAVVSPVAPKSSWQALERGADHIFWLDDDATPLSDAAPGPISLPATVSLMQIDQRRTTGSSMTVVGPVQSRKWPALSPLLRKDVVYLSEDQPSGNERAPIKSPPVLSVVVQDVGQRAVVLAAIDLWRSSGLFVGEVTVETYDRLPDGELASAGWWILEDPQTAEQVRQQDPLSRVALIDMAASSQSVGALATNLWYQFGAVLGERPTSIAVLKGIGTGMPLPDTRLRLPISEQDALPQIWLFLLMGLFVTERLLSLRQGAQ